MTKSLVTCMILSITAGAAASIAVVAAGWGVLAGMAIYSLVGSTSLVGLACARAALPDPAPRHQKPKHERRRAFA